MAKETTKVCFLVILKAEKLLPSANGPALLGDCITRSSCLQLFPGIEFLPGLLASSLHLNSIFQSPGIQLAWALSALPCMNTKPGSQSGTIELTKTSVTMSQRSLRSHQLVCQLTAGPHPNRKFRSCLSLYCLSLTRWWTCGFAPTSSEKLNFSWLFLPLTNYCAKSGGRASPVWNATESNFSYPKYTRTNEMLLNLLNVLKTIF